MQALIADGTINRLRRGVVAGRCEVERAAADRRLSHAMALRTLLLSYDECFASHESAAYLLDLPVLDLPPYAIATRERGAWRGGGNSRVRIAALPADHVTTAQGMRCTAVARTVIDIARSGTFRGAVVVGDSALRNHCDITTLLTCLDECAAWADVGKARRALAPQVVIDADGATPYRLDFYWKEQRVVGEADGMMKYDDPAALRAEKVRQELLERLGLTVVRWTWREMLVETDDTIARLRIALSR